MKTAKASMLTVSDVLLSVPPFFTSLAKAISGELDCSSQALLTYSTDGSPYSVRPRAIVYPKHATDIKHILSFAREYNMPVTVRGGGSAATGGALGEGIIIDMSRYFTTIHKIDMMKQTITVDVGVSVATLRKQLHEWKMDIPLLTPEDTHAVIGGLVGTKSLTQNSFHHGTIREWIESLTVVLDNGEEHRIADGITPSGRLLGIYQAIFPIISEGATILRGIKPEAADDASGYALWNASIGPRQLLDELVGSEGTLAIITSVTFRLAPLLSHSVTTIIPINDLTLLPTTITISKAHKADHIFFVDQTFLSLTEKYHSGLLPVSLDTSSVLFVTHHGNDKEKVNLMARAYAHALPMEADTVTHVENAAFLDKITDRSFLFSLCNVYTGGSQVPINVTDGIIVAPTRYIETIMALEKYLTSLGKVYIMTGNAGSGHLSVTTLFDPHSPTYDIELAGYTEAVFGYVKRYRGGISARGGDGIARTPYLSYIFSEATLNIFKKLKAAWDPESILNPGKKIGLSTQYLREHLIRPGTR